MTPPFSYPAPAPAPAHAHAHAHVFGLTFSILTQLAYSYPIETKCVECDLEQIDVREEGTSAITAASKYSQRPNTFVWGL